MNHTAPPENAPEKHKGNGALSLTEQSQDSGNAFRGEGGRNWLPWITAVVVLGIAVVLFAVLSHDDHRANSTAGPDPYAAKLVFSGVHLSQASNFAGDQLTYIEGTVTNRGDRTVTAATVRVLFANDVGEQPQIQKVPLSLVRAREPYVDTVPVSAAPLKPGGSQEFRLTFDQISPMWNQQLPAISAAAVQTRR